MQVALPTCDVHVLLIGINQQCLSNRHMCQQLYANAEDHRVELTGGNRIILHKASGSNEAYSAGSMLVPTFSADEKRYDLIPACVSTAQHLC